MNLLRIKRGGLLLAGIAALMLMPVALKAQERIAYYSFASGNADIWSMKTDGSDPKQLTTNTGGDGDPSSRVVLSVVATTLSRWVAYFRTLATLCTATCSVIRSTTTAYEHLMPGARVLIPM